MIEKRWLDSLSDPDPEIRKQAVRAITNSGDEDAMIHLAKVYRTDSDPEVREMARQGGIKLRQMGYRVGSSETEKRTEKRDEAEDVYDPMAGLYETPLQEERPPRREPVAEPVKKPRQNVSNDNGGMSWASVAPDLLLYFVIVAVGTFIVSMVLSEALQPLLDDILAESDATSAEVETIRQQLDGSTATYITAAMITGVLSVATLVVQIWIIHYMATASFGGSGNMFAFLRKYSIASAVLTVIASAIILYFIVTTLSAVPDIMSTTTTTTTPTVPDSYLSTVTTLCCGIFFGLIGVIWYFGRMVSQHYYIGTWAGIGTFIAAGIAAQIAIEFLSNFIFTYI